MQTTKVQTSLLICAVWSAPLLLMFIYYAFSGEAYLPNFNIIVSLCSRVGRNEPYLVKKPHKKTGFLASRPLCTGFTPKSIIAFSSNSVELKARIKSSKAPASTPVSPVPEKPAKAPPPKEVWLAKDQKSHAEGRLVPLKKEISITLHTPKIEGTVEKQHDKYRVHTGLKSP